MVQAITPELTTLLKTSRLVGADKTFYGEIEIDYVVSWISPATETIVIPVTSFDIDRSVKMAAAQLNCVVPLENIAGVLGVAADGLVPTDLYAPNNRIRAYAWYGDRANRVQVFTGLVDRASQQRMPGSTISIKARSRMKWLIEQGFQKIGPQGADEAGAIRTEDNGVYVNVDIDYVVSDILDRAGWPAADREIDSTGGLTVAEYILGETSWAELIAGAARLSDLVSFDFWDDELGIAKFKRSPTRSDSGANPVYTFEAGVDVVALSHEIDDEDRATRSIVGGPMTTSDTIETTTSRWLETWATTALTRPVGVWHDPADPDNINVITSIGKDLVRIRQSDRVILNRVNLAPSFNWYAGGLSGDPLDPTIYWALDIDWAHGPTENARIIKFDKATNAVLDTYALPDGQWSDLKSDGVNLWLTNFGDDKLYKRDITDGSAVANYTYSGLTNPTGMYLAGTTIGLFFNNGAKFHLIDTSAPGTITGTQSTAGTHIFGGEIDAVTGTDLYAVASAGAFGNTAGYVWKFSLSETNVVTNEVTTDVVAQFAIEELEDRLGFQSGIGDRVHDLHPGDAAHPFEIRPLRMTMRAVQSQGQAEAVALLQTQLAQNIRQVQDLATIGNPAIQLNDMYQYTDASFNGLEEWVIDAYRSSLSAEGGYFTSLSGLPQVAIGD